MSYYMLVIVMDTKRGWKYYGDELMVLDELHCIQRGVWPEFRRWDGELCTVNPAQVREMRATTADNPMRRGWYKIRTEDD